MRSLRDCFLVYDDSAGFSRRPGFGVVPRAACMGNSPGRFQLIPIMVEGARSARLVSLGRHHVRVQWVYSQGASDRIDHPL